MKNTDFLRKKYPKFVYEGYYCSFSGKNLNISFDFKIEPDIHFKPKITIKNVGSPLRKRELNNLIFHLGLIEIPSYWKATCSPEIVIRAGYLNQDQIKWWKDLIINGMGQFFYENKIDWRAPSFLKIKSNRSRTVLDRSRTVLANRYLVPVGGGRDSIVTLEKLREEGEKINCFMVNPTKVALAVQGTFPGLKDPIVVERKIDPKLLELNKKGFLNGHTPFTAVLSFLSVFCAVLFNYKNIAFSNEKSADEGNVRYLGMIINHQYSKSSKFEKKFKFYCKKYLAKKINYFSFLRAYTELEISKIFRGYPQYFSIFSSCNLAGKTGDRWCGNCPKCLFVYATLYPLLKKKQLLKIFGKDLFENKKLLPIMQSLIGQGSQKPFECVGTYKESRKAFSLSLKKAKKLAKIPYLLQKFNDLK